jgi:hypothetical protein
MRLPGMTQIESVGACSGASTINTSPQHHLTTSSFPPSNILLILSILLSAFYFLFIFTRKYHNQLHDPSYRHHSLPQAVKPSSLGHPYKL